MATNTFYIDESGHTEDLLTAGASYDFAGQPHFVLAAIGPTATDQITALLGGVAARHRLKMDEVKSSHLQTRPKFAKDLVVALIESNSPMFVEALDERFYLIIQIVNTPSYRPGPPFPTEVLTFCMTA